MNGSKNISLGLLLLLTLGFSSVFAQTTKVKGVVTDKTGAPLPFVSVFVPGTSFGIATDAAGRYELQFDSPKDSVRFSLMGYKTVVVRVQRGNEQVRNVTLESGAKVLNEFVVRRKKERYRNKDNPAVELIRLVIDNKSKNRMEHYDYANYNQYEKLEFALSNLSDKIRNNRFTRKYKFVFDNQDTTKMEGRSLLPMYLEERLADVYFRRDPEKKKTIVTADKKVSFENYIDNRGLSAYLNHIYQDVDIYDNNMMLFTNQFLSPIADAGPTFYKYFIADTIKTADSTKLIVLEFYPRNKADRLLEGKLYITLDGKYAIQKADMTANKEINLNFIRDFHLYMDFEKTPDGRYFMNKNTLMADFGLFKGKSGLYGERTVSLKNMVINKPMPASFYEGSSYVENEQNVEKPESFWEQNRHDTLTTAESKVYANIDSLQHMKSFKRTMDIATLLLAGWKSVGPKFEVGPVNTFYNFNPVEGFRLRLGGRTTPKFNKSIYLEGYGAYGFKDEKWKYYFGGSYAFNHKSIYDWPVRAIKASFQHDTKIPGQELQFVQEDNFLLSFKRGNNDKWLYNDIFRIYYLHELYNHSSFQVGFKHWEQTPAGTLSYYKGTSVPDSVKKISTSELSLELRWAPHEQFYQGKNFRIPIPNKYPIFTLRAIAGVKGLAGGDYNYQNITLNIYKMVYLSQLGYSEVVVEGGYIFGHIPYPLLTIHRANQTYAYQLQSYNLMNFLEFVSDRYAGINIDHSFNGFIFNKIPLLKKLKLREVATIKVLYGGLSKGNDPRLDPSKIQFSNYADGVPITYTLGNTPYVEGSVGVANIFKLLRLDLVKRFTYLDNPLIANWGIRGRVRFDF
ncbi:CarboxypepD_reg-like domain-containing protein [Chitinophaga filiformis]|uniref:CarboxypepD_reg-like domain-containing protein n=2 Tax=Chitinophaga filiformis TaxID=104663 RepID=A0A1G7RJG9_CHIFI|nr:CarboxypepD_reg-like domain-containing protein [Chitinophaga filiformis]